MFRYLIWRTRPGPRPWLIARSNAAPAAARPSIPATGTGARTPPSQWPPSGRVEGRPDDTVVDDSGVAQSFGGTVVHVVRHNAGHRSDARHILNAWA
jgi:hypothetical protein